MRKIAETKPNKHLLKATEKTKSARLHSTTLQSKKVHTRKIRKVGREKFRNPIRAFQEREKE